MAYVVELEEEGAMDSDIPTTLTRSKADVPELDERSSAAAANDVVLDKLAQIFSYLRHGRHRKLKKAKVPPLMVRRATRPSRSPIWRGCF